MLATKLYGDMGDWPNDGRLSALNIRRACDAACDGCSTDYIDLYQMHHVDRATPWDEIWQAMEVLRAQGKILYVGSSNFAGWHIAQAQEAAKDRHFLGLVSEQSIYNLVDRTVELEVLPAAEHYGLGVIPWSPLNGGLLGGVIRKERDTSRRNSGAFARRAGDAATADRAVRGPAAPSWARSRRTWALAWLLTRPAVTGPIIGPRTVEQLDGSLRAVELQLDEKVLARLDEIFPGHRTAPEDYAWYAHPLPPAHSAGRLNLGGGCPLVIKRIGVAGATPIV